MKSKIYMTAVDTGWINDEKPIELAAKHHKQHNFQVNSAMGHLPSHAHTHIHTHTYTYTHTHTHTHTHTYPHTHTLIL